MIKKAGLVLIAIILVAIIFTGCKPLFPSEFDQFDIGDTVSIYIGEKLYENKDLWVRLDSITEDSRCSEDANCIWEGRVVMWFSTHTNYMDKQICFSSDTCMNAYLEYFADPRFTFPNLFQMNIYDILPYSQVNETIEEIEYRVKFVLNANLNIDRKPNIYLYPEKKMKMNVSLQFPHGGKVIESDPFYPLQWKNIKVKPNGKIDRKYNFLFYEAEIPDLWQYVEGWVVAMDDLTDFFEKNLKAYSFNENEIADFIEFWIPELKDSPYYEIYPQYTEMVNRVIKLKISPYPDAKLRLHYVIKESEKFFELPGPDIPDFERNGFTAVEWGVML